MKIKTNLIVDYLGGRFERNFFGTSSIKYGFTNFGIHPSIVVNKKGRGTITNNDGVFSIAVNKGETITFSCVGFKMVAGKKLVSLIIN